MQDISQVVPSLTTNRVEIKKIQQEDLRISVGGQWGMGYGSLRDNSKIDRAFRAIEDAGVRRLALATIELGSWDSSLLVFLAKLVASARERGITVSFELPVGIRRLLDLSFAVAAVEDTIPPKAEEFFLTVLGERVLALVPSISSFLAFIGELSQACRRLVLGRAQMRMQDFGEAVHECGVGSLPIISLTSLLFGLILAFVGSVQLTQFGAQVYVAGLVSIGMLRIMGAVMVGVVMSGRIGAAYAALMGAMQANEEVDALQAVGISPVDFLVLPRVLAMMVMTPLLTLYAGFMGVVGGFFVAVTIMGINPYEYLSITVQMTPFRHVLVGLVYGVSFGVIVALAGCFHGIRCARSARAVGLATTSAVVHSIVGIIVATAVITIVTSAMDV